MNKTIKNAILASVFTFATFGSVQFVGASEHDTPGFNQNQDEGVTRKGRNRGANLCDVNPNSPDCDSGAERNTKIDRKDRNVNRGNNNDDDRMQRPNRRSAERGNRNWRYDNDRHERRRDRDNRFQFYFDGYYYPEAYWLGFGVPVYNDRISCNSGRRSVANRGYNRVRTIECNGSQYTYTARRNGNEYRITVSARTGNIVRRREI